MGTKPNLDANAAKYGNAIDRHNSASMIHYVPVLNSRSEEGYMSNYKEDQSLSHTHTHIHMHLCAPTSACHTQDLMSVTYEMRSTSSPR